MDVIIFVPFSVILLLLFCGAGLATEAINSFLDVVPYLLAAVSVSAIVYGVHRLLKFYRSKRPSPFYTVSEAALILSIIPGVIAFAGPTSIDRCCQWFTWFGNSIEAQILTYIGCMIVSVLLLTTIAFFVPVKIGRNILLLVPVAVPFLIYFGSLPVVADSYSAYISTEIEIDEPVQEYRVTKETKVYYPDIWKGDDCLPALSPLKYSKDVFEEGEVVYAVYSSPVPSDKNSESFVTVSNGTTGGLVALADLEWLEETQYTYELRTKEESSVYEEKKFGTLDFYYNGEMVIGTIPRGEVLTVLGNSMTSSDPYLRVAYNGGGGYVPRACVEVVRTPVG